MSNEYDDIGTVYSNRSNHESCVSPTSTRLALALCTLVEHVAQDIVVSVFVHVVDAHMSVIKLATSSGLENHTVFIAGSPTYR